MARARAVYMDSVERAKLEEERKKIDVLQQLWLESEDEVRKILEFVENAAEKGNSQANFYIHNGEEDPVTSLRSDQVKVLLESEGFRVHLTHGRGWVNVSVSGWAKEEGS